MTDDIARARAKRDGGYECLPFDVADEDDPRGMFVLGVEWEMVRAHLRSGNPFTRPVHTRNVERLRSLCERLGVLATFELHEGYDGCETWTEMTVKDP